MTVFPITRTHLLAAASCIHSILRLYRVRCPRPRVVALQAFLRSWMRARRGNLGRIHWLLLSKAIRWKCCPVKTFFIRKNCVRWYRVIVSTRSPAGGGAVAHSRPDPPKMWRNLKLDVIVIDMVYFSFVCLLKLILNNSKPQNQMCDWNQKCFCFVLQKS